MVFKRPNGGRNDRSGSSSNRGKGSGNGPKRSSSPRGNSDRPNKDQSKKFSGERSGNRRSSSVTGGKPYSGRSAGSDERPARKSFSRNADSEGGEKRPYSSQRSRPYSGRPADNDSRPKREFKNRNDREGDNKPKREFKSLRDDRGGDNKPKREFKGNRDDRGGDSRPKREFKGNRDDRGGERKFGSDSPRSPRPQQRERTFGKRASDNFREKQQFRKERNTYNEFRDEPEAPVKTMRGRKEKESKDENIRLNRYIANAGICSRRKADELIEAGVISVNGNVVSELGFKVNPTKDEIRYNGELLKREKMVYVLLNKPKDYITTTDDPQERRTVMHLVEKASRERIYPIGRLDRNTTGLLLMTNDGDLAEKLSHPRSNVTKLYQVELNKSLTQGDMNKISFGVELEDGLIKPDAVSYIQGGTKREIGIQIHSGKNRIVRRIFEHLGYEVVKLDRVVYANLTKKDLPRGRWRYLDEKEIIQLKHLI
ncbi:MAG: pseudouridine synthase [Mucilaginibacter sp.]